MMFTITKIIRYPICKNGEIKYRYYLVGLNKKPIMHEHVTYRRLVRALKGKSNNSLRFLPEVLDDAEINELYEKINELKKYYLGNSTNPRKDLDAILAELGREY